MICISVCLQQVSPKRLKQTSATTVSPTTVGCSPLSHPVVWVWQCSESTGCSGIFVPACPVILQKNWKEEKLCSDWGSNSQKYYQVNQLFWNSRIALPIYFRWKWNWKGILYVCGPLFLENSVLMCSQYSRVVANQERVMMVCIWYMKRTCTMKVLSNLGFVMIH